MDPIRATRILRALVGGVHPATGSELPADSVLQDPNVLRALLVAVMALEQQTVRSGRRANLPPNVGSRWSEEEEQRLIVAFRVGQSAEAIAADLGRTLRAIEARLVRLGLMSPEDRTTSDTFNPSKP
jgi:hypothetical protein